MAFPEPQPGLVISYSYLWHHEHRAGREEGVKARPCVIILEVQSARWQPRWSGWVVIDEVNEFTWPGFDLRPLPRSRDLYAYGFLPPRLFNALMAKLAEVWTEGQGKATARD